MMADQVSSNLTETRFWELIESTSKQAAGDSEAHGELLGAELEKLTPVELVAYQDILNRKVQAIAEFDEELYEALPDLGADDEFDDVCHWTVSLGQQAYERILKSPKIVKKYVKAAKLEWFPTLFGQAYVIYQAKTGQHMPASAPANEFIAAPHVEPPRQPDESIVAKSAAPSISVAANPFGDAKELTVQWQSEFVSTGRGRKIPCIHVCQAAGLVAAARSDGHLGVWTLRGEPCWQTQANSATEQFSNDDMCWQLVIANQTKQLLTRFSRGLRYQVQIWDLETGRSLGELPASGLGSRISNNGEYALLCNPPEPLELWSIRERTKLHTLKSRPDNFLIVASADLMRVIHGDFKTFTVMDAHAGQVLMTFRANSKVTGINLSPDGRWLLGENNRGLTVMGWDVTTGKKIPGLVGFDGGVFSPDSKYYVRFECGTGIFEIWDVATVQKLQEVKWPLFQWIFRNHEVVLGNLLIALTTDGHVRQWDLQTGQLKAHAKLSTNSEFNCIHSADGETIFVSDLESLYCLS